MYYLYLFLFQLVTPSICRSFFYFFYFFCDYILIAIGADTYHHGGYIIFDIILKIFVLLRGIVFVPFQIKVEPNPRRPYLSNPKETEFESERSKPLMSQTSQIDATEMTIDTYRIMQHLAGSPENSSRRLWNASY